MPEKLRQARLFERLQIEPLRASIRFYPIPHGAGIGHALPQSVVGMRAMQAEGNWGVVGTQSCSIHSSRGDQPHPFASLVDNGGVANSTA